MVHGKQAGHTYQSVIDAETDGQTTKKRQMFQALEQNYTKAIYIPKRGKAMLI